MSGGIEETSASFEARSAPRSYPTGKRLKALAPLLVEAMERHGHLHLAPEVRTRLLAMSAATMDRALRAVREQAGGGTRRRSAASSAVRRSVPVRGRFGPHRRARHQVG